MNTTSNNKTILFGGSGFLGNVFLREYPDIISVGRSVPHGNLSCKHISVDIDNLSVLDELEFDNVIFLVGNSNHHMLNSSCMKGFEHNVLPLKKILHYLKNRDLNKFVCFSSILLYGDMPKGRPVNEKDPIYPYQNEYIFSKYIAEQVCSFYQPDVPIINIRLSNIYGDTSLIRPDLIPRLMFDSLTKDDPTVWNTMPERDFIFTVDAADAIMKLLETGYVGNINLGTGKSNSVGRVVEIIEGLSGKEIVSLNKEVSGVMRFTTDISLLKSLTGWSPRFSLEEGLERTYNVMKKELGK